MALHTPDYEYIQGEKHLASLEGVFGDLVRYYVAGKDRQIAKLTRELKDITDALKTINRYTNQF